MTAYSFAFADADLRALPSGALHWPAQQMLVVSDLHFGKSARLARRGGGLLPPYETRATLQRLEADLTQTQAAQVICLGDSFDDLTAETELDTADRATLLRLMAGRHWIWVEGNHDPGPAQLGGRHLTTHVEAGITFRHIAEAGASAEVSGHYHPKARLAGQSRPCFLLSLPDRLILPAYGSYTGGLACGAPALDALMGPKALAILTGQTARALPYAAAYSRPRSSSLAR
ncbi:ligase-associated DNA damage response endonuclease PdeM [Gemmobacter fulvus]|uniref:Ligase-associated DNA damage response endonuclease PdeM n=1 Tax=Gemmobacter fulvus TaxID=2840474 RepID=A0A975P7P7_9RHOB|nr:ligase-associated DNA damage response endonuclease PdeM [Gemmobacter fulvus]MBT9244522.1 ligase-associated DNA damage response endonuclease PdeM [Gemmobacter fulvus]QWK91389.1 ligase-associated DNA damage response endonuclease PdeM [Gemmobacter fulvus]